MQKTLALFLVVSIVISVANLPTSHGISAGGSTWKRALEVWKTLSLFYLFELNTRSLPGYHF